MMTHPDKQALYSCSEAADIIGCNPRTVQRRAKALGIGRLVAGLVFTHPEVERLKTVI